MRESNRRFEVEYYDTSASDGVRDVSFMLTEDGEDALFAAFEREIADNIQEGVFPDQKIHLLKRFCEQRTEHPPWIETDDDIRSYDLQLTGWDYHLLTKIIGESLSNVLGPGGADRYEELAEVWITITEQMVDGPREYEPADPDNGTFQCFIRDGQFACYTNERTGDTWYICTDCKTSFAEIGDEHDCSKYR